MWLLDIIKLVHMARIRFILYLLGSVGLGQYQEVEIAKRLLILLITVGVKRQEDQTD